jgi:predicted phosphodiesterase
MRVALLSDIHGNPNALDAVLHDIEAQGGVDEHWVLGDLAAIGYDPVGALARVAALPGLRVVRGNTDRMITNASWHAEAFDEARAGGEQAMAALRLVRSMVWTQGAVSVTGWADWLRALPVELHATLPDGTRFLGVHASPGRDDGPGLHPYQAAEEQGVLLGDTSAYDLVCVGHTHLPFEGRAAALHVVNLGSVSNPLAPDLRASYVILDADTKGYQVTFRRVDYDHAAVIAATEAAGHPALEYVRAFMRGERRPAWLPA